LARRAVAYSDDDYRRHPSEGSARTKLELSLVVLGNAHLVSGDSVAAQQSYDKVRAILESLSRPDRYELARLARAYALLCACPAPGGPPPTPKGHAARQALADMAMVSLRRAVSAGFGDWKWACAETGLDALRPRDDFQTILSDMAFPLDPIAH
jgi:hypothetical protein